MSGSGACSAAGMSCGMAFVMSLDASDALAIGGYFTGQVSQLFADVAKLSVDLLELSVDPFEPLVYPFESPVDAVESFVDLVESPDLSTPQHRPDPDQDHRVDPERNRRFHTDSIYHHRAMSTPNGRPRSGGGE